MNPVEQSISGNPFFTVALPIVIALFINGWWQNKRIDNLRGDLILRTDDLRSEMRLGFASIERRLERVEGRLDNLSERVARLEGPPVIR